MNRLEERAADQLGLTGGDIISDTVGRIFTVVRNEDSGLLFAVHISGEGRAHPETRIEPISMMPFEYIVENYKPVATARMREEHLESQGLKIVPVEVSTKMAGEGYVALRPYMERGERVKAARAVYAAMLNSVEG
ncbi:MAG: hypothetical protein GOVbin52_18 [Prokaryotic dsDNA virus sp.]|nr:MAG: hypothetical protein GOVbin52_18 [Prokaryotic dsDNA virus sp.]|tara:strand:- start:47053 stop:47457 length:405 start_codon:yes stop_codon:yes gene_type:complete